MGADRSGVASAVNRTALGPIVVIAGALGVGYLGLFFAYPLASIAWRGLSDGFAGIAYLGTSRFWSVLWFTLWQSVVSTLLTMVLAAPATVVLARWRFFGDRVVSAIVAVPFVLPTIVVASAFASLFGYLGWPLSTTSSSGFNTAAIIAAHVYFNLSVVIRLVGTRWRQLDPAAMEAARLLGANAWGAFRIGMWPRLRRAVVSAAVIVVLFTFTSFAVVLVLGGPGRSTLETEVYRYAVSRADFSTAAVLGLVQLVAVAAIAMALRWSQDDAQDFTERGASFETPLPRRQRSVAVIVVIAMLLATLAPLVSMAAEAFTVDGRPGLGNLTGLDERLRILPVTGWRAVGNSLLFASFATVLATGVGVALAALIAYGPARLARFLDIGVLLPLGTSAVMIGFGILVAFDSPPIDFRSSVAMIPIGQSLIGIGFVTRAVGPALAGIDRRVRESAQVLGATTHQVRRLVDVPAAVPAIAVGAGFAFSISLGEFGATSFVNRDPQWLTVPLAIGRLLGQPGERPHAYAMMLGVVLVAVTASVAAVAERRGVSRTL